MKTTPPIGPPRLRLTTKEEAFSAGAVKLAHITDLANIPDADIPEFLRTLAGLIEMLKLTRIECDKREKVLAERLPHIHFAPALKGAVIIREAGQELATDVAALVAARERRIAEESAQRPEPEKRDVDYQTIAEAAGYELAENDNYGLYWQNGTHSGDSYQLYHGDEVQAWKCACEFNALWPKLTVVRPKP